MTNSFIDSDGNKWDVPFFAGTITLAATGESAAELRDGAFRNGWHD